MNKFKQSLISAVLAAGTVAGKHPLESQPLHVRNLRHGTKGDQSIRLTRTSMTEMKDEKLRLRDGTAEIPLTPQPGDSFTGELFVGTGLHPVVVQTLTMTFSSDFSKTIVADSSCTTCGSGTLFVNIDSMNFAQVENSNTVDT